MAKVLIHHEWVVAIIEKYLREKFRNQIHKDDQLEIDPDYLYMDQDPPDYFIEVDFNELDIIQDGLS